MQKNRGRITEPQPCCFQIKSKQSYNEFTLGYNILLAGINQYCVQFLVICSFFYRIEGLLNLESSFSFIFTSFMQQAETNYLKRGRR